MLKKITLAALLLLVPFATTTAQDYSKPQVYECMARANLAGAIQQIRVTYNHSWEEYRENVDQYADSAKNRFHQIVVGSWVYQRPSSTEPQTMMGMYMQSCIDGAL